MRNHCSRIKNGISLFSFFTVLPLMFRYIISICRSGNQLFFLNLMYQYLVYQARYRQLSGYYAKSHCDLLTLSLLVNLKDSGTNTINYYRSLTLNPIFHCDAKPFALGTCVGLDPQCHTSASPNAKYTNMLVYFGVT